MIKEALQYIIDLKAPQRLEIGSSVYTDKTIQRVDACLRAEPLLMSTLTSLIDYIKACADCMAEKMLLQVVSPTHVKLLSRLDKDRKRENLVEVKAVVPDFTFNRFLDNESFLISLQSKFIHSEDRSLLLKFAGTVESGTVGQYGDDGVTQKAIIKTGVASKSDAVIPNPVTLCPYRSFVEIEQPESEFVFRMRGEKIIECAIFEADGGAWKNEAMKRIKEYLISELSEYEEFTVIS